MAHNYIDNDGYSYGRQVINNWLADAASRGVTRWTSNDALDKDFVAYLNAHVPYERGCTYLATLDEARAEGAIVVHDSAYMSATAIAALTISTGSHHE